MKELSIILLIISLIGCNEETYIEGLIEKPDDNTNLTEVIDIIYLKNEWLGVYLASDGAGLIGTSSGPYAWQVEKVKKTGEYVIVDLGTNSSTKYLNYKFGVFFSVPDISPTSSWIFEEITIGGNIRIKHVESGGYINVEPQYLVCGSIQPSWVSAAWTRI